MKKVFIITFFALLGITQSQAQVSFKPGIRAGLNFSHFTQGSGNNGYYYDSNGNYVPNTTTDNYTPKTDFNVGFYGALHLTKYYTLQPEINYSNQGSYLESGITKTKIDVSYLSIGVINKFTFTDKFNFHVGPTIDFIVDKARYLGTESDVDLAFTAGFGYNFTPNFGIEGRIKKGIVPVIYNYGSDHTNVVFQLGITYTFDVK